MIYSFLYILFGLHSLSNAQGLQESIKPELQKAEITIEFVQKYSRSITDSAPIVPYKKSLSVGGQVFSDIDSNCGEVNRPRNESHYGGMPLPRARGVGVDSAFSWFRLDDHGKKYASNPRIKHLLDKGSWDENERAELIAIYLCLWDTENPDARKR